MALKPLDNFFNFVDVVGTDFRDSLVQVLNPTSFEANAKIGNEKEHQGKCGAAESSLPKFKQQHLHSEVAKASSKHKRETEGSHELLFVLRPPRLLQVRMHLHPAQVKLLFQSLQCFQLRLDLRAVSEKASEVLIVSSLTELNREELFVLHQIMVTGQDEVVLGKMTSGRQIDRFVIVLDQFDVFEKRCSTTDLVTIFSLLFGCHHLDQLCFRLCTEQGYWFMFHFLNL